MENAEMDAEPVPNAEPLVEPALTEGDIARSLAAEGIVKNYVIAAVTLSVVPLPLFDIAAVAALQLRMIKKLSDHYGKPFSEARACSIISSLVGGIGGFGAGAVTASLLKVVPGFGWMLGLAAFPALAGGATYGIGKVFMKHYEEGGTICSLDTKALSAYYAEQVAKGRELTAKMRHAAKDMACSAKSATCGAAKAEPVAPTEQAAVA